jgi:UDP-4-amino-4,6-dideoxy-N-acetyl-beta-L-altrosamine transaminase
MIPYGKQHITEEDIKAVVTTLKSDFLTQGPKISEFEEAFADYVGSQYAVAVANGTAALHLCALAIDVRAGDRVITTPITFAASANCIKYCGGEITFADIDADTYTLDIEAVRNLLESAPKGYYKGIIPVDFSGYPVNLEAFRALADQYNLWIIEDACHAPGGYFTGSDNNRQNCGNGAFADLAIFSFHPVKHIAAGEGGMITTNDPQLYERLLRLRTHGITRDSSSFQNSEQLAFGIDNPPSDQYPGWYMEMQELGYNYRITDFQAALGMSQLQRADSGILRRREIAARYDEAFGELSIVKQNRDKRYQNAFHLYVIETEKRFELYQHLRKHNIYTQVHYFPLHLMPYYQQFGWQLGDFPNAEKYYQRCLSLPMYPSLSEEEQSYVIDTIRTFFNR